MTAPFVNVRPLTALVSIHPDGHPKTACEPWGQSMVIAYRPSEPGTADIALLNARAPLSRAVLRALRDKLVQHGLHAIYARREEGHTLPGAVEISPGLLRVDLTTGMPGE